MLWRFSFASASTLDALLSRETPPSLEELLDEQELLSEIKTHNNKLVGYLCKEDSVKSLLQWVISGLDELDQQAIDAQAVLFDQAVASPTFIHGRIPGPGPDSPPISPVDPVTPVDLENDRGGFTSGAENDTTESRSRYPAISTEVLTSDLWLLLETVMQNKEHLLRPFWEAVLPPLDPPSSSLEQLAASRSDQSERDRAVDEFWSDADEERERKREMIRGMWVRVNAAFMKRTAEMIHFIQTIPNIVERIMANIDSPAVQDMLIRIVSSEEAGVPGVIDWLANQGLIPRLVALLSPHYPTSTHSIAADLIKSIITLCAPSPFNPHGGNAEQQAGQIQPAGQRDNRLIRELVNHESIQTMTGFMLDPLDLSDKDWKGINDDPSHVGNPFVVHPLPSISSASSSLSHVCNILVELIRRNNSDFSEPHLFHTLRNRIITAKQSITESTDDEMRAKLEDAMLEISPKMGIVHLGSLLEITSERFDGLHQFLLHPRSTSGLTFERFRIVELYAELLHASNMSILNRTPGSGPVYTPDGILSGGLDGLEKLGSAIEGEQSGEAEAQVTQARELPVSSGSTDCSLTDDESDDEMLEDVAIRQDADEPPPPSQEDVARLRDVMEEAPAGPSSDRVEVLAPGDRLKQMYIQYKVLPTVVDLFFEYPNNDFLHHVVYDLLQQILNGRLTPGLNRDLVVELIRDANLIERILDAQRLNDRMINQPRTPRLAYMGHTILIAEELVKFFDRCPADLSPLVKDSYNQSEWNAFVEGSLRETKDKDARPLAGGKPMNVVVTTQQVDIEGKAESDDSDDDEEVKFGEPLSRTMAAEGERYKRSSGGFGFSGSDGGEDDDEGHTWSGSRRNRDSSDEDDDDADWLRPTSDDALKRTAHDDLDDDDAWGTFSSAPERDPFADDADEEPVNPLQRLRPTPLTPNDWASEFDDEFLASAPMETTWSADDDDDDVPAIVVPNINDDDEPGLSTPNSTWSFSGDDEGEDLPPTISPTFEDAPVLGLQGPMSNLNFKPTVPPRSEVLAPSIVTPAEPIPIPKSPSSPISIPPRQPPSPRLSISSSPTSPIPIRGGPSSPTSPKLTFTKHARRQSLSFTHPGASIAKFEAISPPDPALLAAASDTEPLGPGVSGDTHMTPDGMLERIVDGERVIVPQDEIVRGVEDALERSSDGSLDLDRHVS